MSDGLIIDKLASRVIEASKHGRGVYMSRDEVRIMAYSSWASGHSDTETNGLPERVGFKL